ncbi:hypothetical protein VMCG_10541 [Cytospora schulzeri]|uniref:PPM-type phosphatase domain-containing protein n=1 Tax=Cytospora schulzeri TaxID=448051 RepID=A0A423VAJ8_9PEZI|nr:hypothetical protein VMCG_10541 [Valsa malicola]
MVQEGYHGLDWKRRNYPILDLNAANAVLRRDESSQSLDAADHAPVVRFDTLRLEATMPCQDNFTYEKAEIGAGRPWHFWGVFDGHAGWQTSTVLSQALVSYVATELQGIDTNDAAMVDGAIKQGFLRLDNDIVQDALKSVTSNDHRPRAEIIADIAPAISGSMAVLAIFNPGTSTLRVASVGDSQAVLGQHSRGSGSSSSFWTAVSLSTPQTPDRPDELARIRAEHPGEPDSDLLSVDRKRLLGLPVTRAFGDHRWKWPESVIADSRKKFYAFPARPNAKTPPYLTAEPEISTTIVKDGDFAVLATDGLWETMSPEHVVDCMQLWIRDGKLKGVAGSKGQEVGEASESECVDSIPVFSGDEEPDSRVGYPWDWKGRVEDFVVEDDNAATHLTRNALGGKRREQFCTILGVLPPHKDDAHDDITVQVLFFGKNC